MSFETNIQDGIAILRIKVGRLDANVAPDLKKEVDDIVAGGTSRIMVDLQAVKFMDSSGLGAIVACFKLTGQKGDFVLCNMNEAVTEIFALTHMDTLFDIYPNVDEGFQKMCA